MRKILLAAIGGVALLGSCGDDGGKAKSVDASTTDGSTVDAKLADAAPPSPVTVNATEGGSGIGSATVYFLNADGSIAGTELTDATGTASHTVTSGGSVTVVVLEPPQAVGALPANTDYTLFTITGVKPGDQLAVVDSNRGSNPPVDADVTIGSDGAAIQFMVQTSCDPGDNIDVGYGSSENEQINADGSLCVPPIDAIVYASGSGINQAAVVENIPLTGNALNTTQATYVTRTSMSGTLNDVPVSMSSFDFTQEAHTARGFIDEQGFGSGVNTTTSFTIQRATVAGSTEVSTSTFPAAGANLADNAIYENAAAASTYTLDVGSNLQPQITSLPVFTAATQALTWTENAVGSAAPVAAIGAITFQRIVSEVSTSVEWHLLQARNAQTISYPTLPATIYAFNPTSDDTVTVEQVILAKPAVGYDAIRAVAFAISDPAQLVTAALGKASIEIYSASEARAKHASKSLWKLSAPKTTTRRLAR